MTVSELEVGEALGLDRLTLAWPAHLADTQPKVRARRSRGRLIRRTLALSDIVGLTLGFVIAELLYGSHSTVDAVRGNLEPLAFALSLPLWILGAKIYGLYDGDERRTDHATSDDLKGVFHLITVGAWLFYGLASLTGLASPSLPKLAAFWLMAICFVTVGRAVGRTFARRRPSYVQRALIVGTDDSARLVAEKLGRHPEYKIELIGLVGESHPSAAVNGATPVLGEPSDLLGLITALDVDRVIFTGDEAPRDTLVRLVRALHEHDVQVDLVPPLYEVVGPSLTAHAVEGLALLGLPPVRLTSVSSALKRGTDVAGAILLLVLFSPLLLLVAAWIKLDSRGPVLYRQWRVGGGGRHFRIYKFRTMFVDADERKQELLHLNHLRNGDGRLFKIPDDPRVTACGRFLRRHFLDELPQLLNVLRGEMSLVGPRPLIPEEDVFIGEYGPKRLRLKPGMTGIWQVLGHNHISIEEMIKLDYIYVTNWSLAGDFRLLVQTAGLVARGETGSY